YYMTIMDPIAWLTQNEPGFANLPEPDRQAVFHFALLWSLFEAKALGTSASARSIKALVDECAGRGRLEIGQFMDPLEYFRARYVGPDDQPTAHFQGLHLRANDSPELVRSVLQRTVDDAPACVSALFIVILRLRNNLFHGVKWAYGLEGQRNNFEH